MLVNKMNNLAGFQRINC